MNWIKKLLKREKKKSNKTNTFKCSLNHLIKWVESKIRLTHTNLKNITEADLDELRDDKTRNVYQLLLDWFIDVIQFGIPAAFVYSAIAGWQGIIGTIKWILALGILLWILCYVIKNVKRAIMEE